MSFSEVLCISPSSEDDDNDIEGNKGKVVPKTKTKEDLPFSSAMGLTSWTVLAQAQKQHQISSSSDDSDVEILSLPQRLQAKRDVPAFLQEAGSSSGFARENKSPERRGLLEHVNLHDISSSDDEFRHSEHVKNQQNDVFEKGESEGEFTWKKNWRDCPLTEAINDFEMPHAKEQAAAAKKRKAEGTALTETRLKKREELLKQREEEKAAKEREKLMKQVRRDEIRNNKPDEYIKFLRVNLDMRLLELHEAVEVPKMLQEADLRYTLIEQSIPHCVTWTKTVTKNAVSDHLRVVEDVREEDENQALVLLSPEIFLEACNCYKESRRGGGEGETLAELVQRLKTVLQPRQITLIIHGVEKYFKLQNRKQQADYRKAVMEDGSSDASQLPTSRRPRKKKGIQGLEFDISRVDMEEAIIDLMVQEGCDVRLADCNLDVARTVVAFTKAIAQAPFKQRNASKDFADLANTTGQTVKVDKNGKGLLLLWRRQIQQFNLMSSEMAEAIVAHYPSPSSLVKAYRKCSSIHEAEMLLENIMVRRGAGLLVTSRRLGPEVSRKIYLSLMSINGNLVLDGD